MPFPFCYETSPLLSLSLSLLRYGVCFHLFPTFSFSFLSLQTFLTSSPSPFFLFSIEFIPIFQFFGSSILFFVLSSLCSLWCCSEGCFFLKNGLLSFSFPFSYPPFFLSPSFSYFLLLLSFPFLPLHRIYSKYLKLVFKGFGGRSIIITIIIDLTAPLLCSFFFHFIVFFSNGLFIFLLPFFSFPFLFPFSYPFFFLSFPFLVLLLTLLPLPLLSLPNRLPNRQDFIKSPPYFLLLT